MNYNLWNDVKLKLWISSFMDYVSSYFCLFLSWIFNKSKLILEIWFIIKAIPLKEILINIFNKFIELALYPKLMFINLIICQQIEANKLK